MPRMQADTNLFYHRSTYEEGAEFEVLDTDVKALEDQNLAHVVEVLTSKQKDVETSEPSNGETTEPEKSLGSMNRSELEEYATSLGMEDLEQYGTKAELIEAIETKQKEA